MDKRQKKKRKKEYNGPFVGVERKLLESEAFSDLTIHEKWLYIEFRSRYYGDNNNRIVFTCKDAKNIMSESTFIKSRKQLIERGLIDVIRRGGLEKQPTIYGISNRWRKYGKEDFIKVDLKRILPRLYKSKFKKKHEFLGNRFKEKENL